LLYPITPKQFLEEYWEKKPLHIKRNNADYYDGLFSKQENDNLLLEGKARVNLAKVNKQGRKDVANLDNEFGPDSNTYEHVQQKWNEGYSVQVLHPQQESVPVAQLLSALESDCQDLWGSNAYITPRGARGFAPHYDDVEVFMLQLEGAKKWQLFKPPPSDQNGQCELPKTHSIDFLQSELEEENKLFDGLLEQGDLLYFPRGIVHTGQTPDNVEFSNHLTVSTYQASAWSDFLNEALPGAIENATRKDKRFREGLPLRYLTYMGSAFKKGPESDADSLEKRKQFRMQFKSLLKSLADHVDADDAADLRGSDFVVARLNPIQIKHDDEDSEDEFGMLKSSECGPSPTFVSPTAHDLPASGLQVRWRDPSWVRLALDVNTETGDMEVLLNHCLKNDRKKHMAGGDSHGADAPADFSNMEAKLNLDVDELPKIQHVSGEKGEHDSDLENADVESDDDADVAQEGPQTVGSLRFEEMFFPALRQLCRGGVERNWIPAAGLGKLDHQDNLELLELLWGEQLLETKVAGKKRLRASDDIPV